MTKKSRAPRRRKPNITPLQLAVLTGAPLPADVSKWYVANLEHPDQPGLLSVGVCATPFAEVWRQYHGSPMTDEDRAALRARLPEIKAAADATRTRHATAAPGSASPSNWPSSETDGFQPVATLDEGIEK